MQFKHGVSFPADDNGGTCTNVIELANPAPLHGGYDPEQPQVFTPFEVRGLVLVGHAADAADPDAPVVVPENTITRPGGGQMAEARCPQCRASVTIGNLDGDTLVLVEHQPGCPVLAALLAQVPQ